MESDVAVLSQQPALLRLIDDRAAGDAARSAQAKDELAAQFLLFAQEKES